MSLKRNKKIIKEYVSEILKEDDFGTDAFGGLDYSASGLSGGTWTGAGSGGSLYKTFVQPFVDVIGVTAGKTKELARRSITLLQVAFEATMTTLIPFLTDSYDEIFAQEAKDIEKIKNEYGNYYRASAEALGGPGASVLALIAFPGPALASTFARTAPKAAKTILGIATGGISDKYLGGAIFDSYAKSYVNLISEDKNTDTPKKEKTLADKIGSKKFIGAMLDRSPTMAAAARAAQEIYKNTLISAFEEAKQILSAKSIGEIEKIIGKKLPDDNELKKITGQDRQRAEQELLITIKKSIKKMYITRLEGNVAPVAKAFGDDHPYVVDYKKVINKINAL